MSWRHPSDSRLNSWAAGRPGLRSSGHAEHCEQCQERLEQMTELEPKMRAELAASLVPSASFEERLRERLARKLADREALAIIAGLMDAGLKTSQLLVESEQEEDDNG